MLADGPFHLSRQQHQNYSFMSLSLIHCRHYFWFLLALLPITSCETFVNWDKQLGQSTIDRLAGEWTIEQMTFFPLSGDSLDIPFRQGTFGFTWYQAKQYSPENGDGWFILDAERTRFRYGPLGHTNDQIFINVNQAATLMFSASCRLHLDGQSKLVISDLATTLGPDLATQVQGRTRIVLARK
jgi:hypothetical protein